MSQARELSVLRLGRVEYEDGLVMQRLVGEARLLDLIPDTLLLLEHAPVLTLGRGATRENIVASAEQLARLAVETFETDRGGDVTYHGPGQVVGYPIFLLSPDRQDVRKYIRNLEETIVRALGRFGITASHIPKWPGVWLGQEGSNARKIAAIGVHLSRWLSTHGFALNVNTQMSHFDLIVPCGLRGTGVTSMERELGHPAEVAAVETALAEACADVFGAEIVASSLQTVSTVSVAVTRDGRNGLEVLLLERTVERGGFWQIVTGRIEPEESARDAARRELHEETGAALEVHSLSYSHSFALGPAVPPRIGHETAFFARWPRGKAVRLSSEHRSSEWAPLEAAIERLPFKGLKEAVRLASSSGFDHKSN